MQRQADAPILHVFGGARCGLEDGDDGPGGDSIHADAPGCELAGERAGEREDGTLGGGVID